jgi:hypothetical protein
MDHGEIAMLTPLLEGAAFVGLDAGVTPVPHVDPGLVSQGLDVEDVELFFL